MLSPKPCLPEPYRKLRARGFKHSDTAVLRELQKILNTNDISIVFQPVVSLTDGSVIGYEALTRGPQGSILQRPDALFAAAAAFDLVWELEYLCRSQALARAKDIIPHKMLFINVDPKIINDPRFHKGHTREILNECQANAGNIIFEITEKTAIDDYKSFCRILDNYTSQGYKIAIDDTGSGYSGLKRLAQTHPHFIKLDMDLIRDIDSDSLNQALVKALNDFATISNSKVIAEGVETEEELATLIALGVRYAQGFFLQKPAPEFLDLLPKAKEIIITRNARKRRESFHTPLTMPIGEIAEPVEHISPATFGYQALAYFHDHPGVQAIPIVNNDQAVGLLVKNKFFANLATQHGVAVYLNRSIATLMNRNPLIVDYGAPLEMVSKAALSRNDDDVYDYILVNREERHFGIVTVKKLLEKTSQLELNRAKHTNPLTGLPGSILIERELEKLVPDETPYALLHFDLDNFKSYNDVYGFENGDKILQFTAATIRRALDRAGGSNPFLGHSGGDDFVAITRQADAATLCEEIIARFDREIGNFYSEEDNRKGYVVTTNRRGQAEEFPVITLSIGVATNRARRFDSVAELSESAAAANRQCKLTGKSGYRIE